MVACGPACVGIAAAPLSGREADGLVVDRLMQVMLSGVMVAHF